MEPASVIPPTPNVATLVRHYRVTDRAAVRAICADTGFLGQPIDPVFEDRELFADYLTSYYTDCEPEATFVCELDGEVKGYVMGSRQPDRKSRYERRLLPRLVAQGLWRYWARPYRASTRRYVHWLLRQARRENPFTPPKMAHFHFNVRPEARSFLATTRMLDIFLRQMAEAGEKQVYAQVVAYENRRSARLFARFGFRVVDQREITKYRELHAGKVYLLTIIKDLQANQKLFGLDLRSELDSESSKMA